MSSAWNDRSRSRDADDNFFDTSKYFDTSSDSFDKKLETLLKRRPELAEFYKDYPRRRPEFGGSNFPFSADFSQQRTHFPHFASRYTTPQDHHNFSSPGGSSERANPSVQKPTHNVSVASTQTAEDCKNSAQDSHHKQGLPQYNLRNTVDLGQKTAEEFNEIDKSKRSMSAPPDGRNVPVQSGMQPNTQKQQPDSRNESRQPVERIIPIVVEGRDEPLINKIDTSSEPRSSSHHDDVDSSARMDHDPFDQHFGDHIGNTTRMFPNDRFAGPRGKFHKNFRYSHDQEPPQQHPVYTHSNQQTKPVNIKQQEQHFKEQENVPVNESKPQTSHKVSNEENEYCVPPHHEPQINDPIEKIQHIQNDVLELMTQVENFSGKTKKDKEYIYLDEMLTRNLLKLDVIDTEGKENIRLARKEAIKCIQQCISVLENKAEKASIDQGNNAQISGDGSSETASSVMDSNNRNSAEIEKNKDETTKMDVEQ